MRRSGASWLTLGYALLIAYASLHPFGPWDWPVGLTGWAVGRLEWPRYWSRFDIWANAAGYLPFGLLCFASAWRSGLRVRGSLLLAVLLPAALAYGLELAQRFVALRVPSLADWVLNSGGAAVGALLGLAAARLGWLERWGHWRERWFVPNSAGALALLALWPLGLLFPLPAPLAQGQFLPPLQDALLDALSQAGWLERPTLVAHSVSSLERAAATLLGLLAPSLLLLAVARPGWQLVPQLLGVVLAGAGMTALSTSLGFGPDKAWAWLTPLTVQALGVGLVLATLAALLPARACAVLALPLLTGLILLVARMAADPFVLLDQQRWALAPRMELFGLLQWLGWLWPLLALAWLMAGLVKGDAGGAPKLDRFSRRPRR